jgi:hypothetical protein
MHLGGSIRGYSWRDVEFFPEEKTNKVASVACAQRALHFLSSSPVRRLDQLQVSGGLGEHCSSPAVGRGVCAPPGRVAQPRLLAADRGNSEGAVNRGRLLWVTFLGKTRKVTGGGATPRDFDLVIHVSIRPSAYSTRTAFDRRALRRVVFSKTEFI